MNSYDEQMDQIRTAAKLAAKRTPLDKFWPIDMALKKISISPANINASYFDGPQEARIDAILAQVPDMITLATFAWYELKRGDQEARQSKTVLAWLVERPGDGGAPEYLCMHKGYVTWKPDITQSMKFVDKASAEQMHSHLDAGSDTRVAEHMWPDGL